MTMRLATPEVIQKLRRKLSLKAKEEPTYRFYSLYDKICQPKILAHAYALVKANAGASGLIEFGSRTLSCMAWRGFLMSCMRNSGKEGTNPKPFCGS